MAPTVRRPDSKRGDHFFLHPGKEEGWIGKTTLRLSSLRVKKTFRSYNRKGGEIKFTALLYVHFLINDFCFVSLILVFVLMQPVCQE